MTTPTSHPIFVIDDEYIITHADSMGIELTDEQINQVAELLEHGADHLFSEIHAIAEQSIMEVAGIVM